MPLVKLKRTNVAGRNTAKLASRAPGPGRTAGPITALRQQPNETHLVNNNLSPSSPLYGRVPPRAACAS